MEILPVSKPVGDMCHRCLEHGTGYIVMCTDWAAFLCATCLEAEQAKEERRLLEESIVLG